MKRFLTTSLILIALTAPVVSFAAPSLWPTGYWGPLLSCTGNYDTNNPPTSGPTNPCIDLCDLLQTGQNVIYFMATIVFFILAPILFIYGGFMLLISAGSPERITSGRKAITGTIVGVLITLGAFLLVNTVLWLFGIRTSGQYANQRNTVSWPSISCSAPPQH